jgi:hypothetical protein
MNPRKMKAGWLLCAVTALSMAVPVSAKAQTAPPDIVVTAKDNGKDITLHGSQRLVIRFSSPAGIPFSWSALMTPDALLAFTDPPPPEQKNDSMKGGMKGGMLMVGGPHETVFAFHAARYTETSSEQFMLIFCSLQCDLKNRTAKIFKLDITTKKE